MLVVVVLLALLLPLLLLLLLLLLLPLLLAAEDVPEELLLLPLTLTVVASHPLVVELVPVLTDELPDDEELTEMIDCGRLLDFDSGSVPMKELRSFGAAKKKETLH